MVGPAVDCLNNPLGAVRTLFEKASLQSAAAAVGNSMSDWGAKDLIDDYLYRQGGYEQVPEINLAALSAISNKTLVRFRGMVQDMFDAEYYLGAYKEGETWRTTKFTDVMDQPIHENCETRVWDRRVLYCVPVPGESNWVKEAFATSSIRSADFRTTVAATTTSHSEKRPREKAEDDNDVEMDSPSLDDLAQTKRLKEENADVVDHSSQTVELNMPLGESNLLPCIVKVYDGADSDIKLNDIVEFTGVLTFDPELTSVTPDSSADSLMEENLCSQLPASRVPRLHSISHRKLSLHRIFEHLPITGRTDAGLLTAPEALRQARDSLMKGLTNILGGDYLSAEYLLLHLLSQVHHRLDSMALGKVSLNIVVGNSPSDAASPLAIAVGSIIRSLLPCSHIMPLSLSNLNNQLMAPRKDYTKNRLVTGSLQLAEGTYLTLDETALTAGQLNSVGIQNVQTLKNLMEWQKVEYDFEYYKLEMPTDIPVLIISSARSRLLPADIVVPVRSAPNIVPYAAEDADIANWRSFVSSVRNSEHSLEPSMQKFVENELVQARQHDSSLTPEDFHRWLNLARLLSLSHGESTLSLERWQRVREMERLCTERLQSS